MAPVARRATCFCGRCAATVRDESKIASTSICHCSICRRLTGAPFLANVLTPPDNVVLEARADDASEYAVVEPDALAGLKTSKNVVRYRCPTCASPLVATLKLGKQHLRAVPLALFPRPHPPNWAPQHHFHYDDRVVDVPDGVVKSRSGVPIRGGAPGIKPPRLGGPRRRPAPSDADPRRRCGGRGPAAPPRPRPGFSARVRGSARDRAARRFRGRYLLSEKCGDRGEACAG